MRRVYFFAVAAAALLLAGCSRSQEHYAEVVRLDLDLASFCQLDSARQHALLDSLGGDIEMMMAVMGRDSVSVALLDAWSRSEVVEKFQPDVDMVFPSSEALSREVGEVVWRAGQENLRWPSYRFVTVVWPKLKSMVRVSDTMLIALNHYLGADYPGYQGWPAYRLVEKSPEMLPYDLAAACTATQYPFEPAADGDGTTLLSRMLYEGALVAVRMSLVRDAHLDLAMGWTPDQLQAAEAHLPEIWEEMTLRKLIYDTSPITADRYLQPSPSTPLLQGRAPGRIGVYVGYRIVSSYLKNHPDTPLASMLSPDFYSTPQALIDSGFSGK